MDRRNMELKKVVKFSVKGYSMHAREDVKDEKETDSTKHANLLARYDSYMTFEWVITVDEYT
jgi:hypothetical protein